MLHFLSDGRVGGPQVRIVRVHTAMNKDGCPVETIVASPSTQPADYFRRTGMRHLMMTWHKPSAERPFFTGLAWLFSGLWIDVAACRKIMREYSDAIVHVNGAILLGAALAAIFEKRIWVWHLNDTSVPRFLAFIVRILLSLGKGKAIAASNAVVSYYRLEKFTEVVYPPVEITDDHVRISLDSPIIRLGVMANFSPGKGLERVIEAFAIAHKTTSNLRLFIAGRILENKRWYFEALQQQISELGIEASVEFSGFVSAPLDWMDSLDIFLFSSQSEAAPVALIEALACGLPIISGDIPPTREILGGCGILTPLGDAEAMAKAIVELAGNPQLRRELGEKAEKRGRSVFSASAIARQYCEIYSEILRGK